MLIALGLCLAGLVAAPQDPAWTWENLDLADGRSCEFALQLPPEYDPERATPLLLALPPGDQSRTLVERVLELYWSAEAAERGWIVVSPAAPTGTSFRGEQLELLDALLAELPRRFRIEAGRPHLAGVSNGGRSAVALAQRDPSRFASLLGAPGMGEPGLDPRPLAALPVSLFVGGEDLGWREPMAALHDALVEQEAVSVTLRVFEGEGHMPTSLSGALLFDELDAHQRRALAAETQRQAVGELLDSFHREAAAANEENYFALFAPEGVFLGTDATERWSVSEFRAYAHAFFSAGVGWTYTPLERHVQLSADGRSAWFDERLHSESYGEMRGSGSVRRLGENWRIAQYVLSFAVPNEVAPSVVRSIAEHEEAR